MSQAFKASELTRAIKAAKAAGLTDFEVHIDEHGRPFIRVGKLDTSEELLERELDNWRRDQARGRSD